MVPCRWQEGLRAINAQTKPILDQLYNLIKLKNEFRAFRNPQKDTSFVKIGQKMKKLQVRLKENLPKFQNRKISKKASRKILVFTKIDNPYINENFGPSHFLRTFFLLLTIAQVHCVLIIYRKQNRKQNAHHVNKCALCKQNQEKDLKRLKWI